MLDNLQVKDILGVEPVAEATKHVTEKTIEGVCSFLNLVFTPGLQEVGFMIKDKIRAWRLENVLRVIDKAKGKLDFDGENLQIQANARVGLSIIDECSKVDDEELQNLWAGLFASSCSEDGKDDSNIIFVDILKRLSSVEARVLAYACEHCPKVIYPNGLIIPGTVRVNFPDLVRITGIADVYRLDREFDHLGSLSLFRDSIWTNRGFSIDDISFTADITPSALGLNLYYRTHCFKCSIAEFWKDELIESKNYVDPTEVEHAERSNSATDEIINNIFDTK